jgi:hypothetical protein
MALGLAAAGCSSGAGDFPSATDDAGADRADCDGAACPVTITDPDGGDGPLETVDAGIGGSWAFESGETCFDGQDNNDNSAVDCAESTCQSEFRSCCVGRTSAACCDAPVDGPSLALAGCSGVVGVGCSSAGLLPFGSPSPFAASGVLFPNGDRSYDSGVVVDSVIAPGRAIGVRATLALPAAACADGCVEAVGVGLTAAASYGSESTVRPLAGVVLSAARRTADLVLDGEVAGRVALPAGETSFDVVLTLGPDGSVTVDGLPGSTLTGRVVRSGSLRLVAWGRNMNSTDLFGARVVSLVATTTTCDAPAVWTERGELVVGAGATAAPASVAGPSVADSGSESRLVFEVGGRIVLARRTSPMANYALVGGYDNAALSDLGGGALRDPELVAVPGGAWRLFVALPSGAIGVADGLAMANTFGPPAVSVSPSDLGPDIVRLDGPSVLAPSSLDTPWHLVVRALDTAGRSSLVLLESADGIGFRLRPLATLESATLRAPQGSFAAFDRDEVAAPDVFRHGGTVGIAYAGRAGARWSIGLLVSDDFAHVRPAPLDASFDAGAVLAGTGAASAVDALSVTDPDVVVRGELLELFYVGSDGVSARLARVARPSLRGL